MDFILAVMLFGGMLCSAFVVVAFDNYVMKRRGRKK